MSKAIVTYFSASGMTARLAGTLAAAIGAELREITPAQPYTAADLDWRDRQSRSSWEMTHKEHRPHMCGLSAGSLPLRK